MKPVKNRVKPPYKDKSSGRIIDKHIAYAVRILWENGIETTESCEGGDGHSFFEPTVRFCGDASEGYKAVSIAMENGLKPFQLRQFWTILDNRLVGPQWELTFVYQFDPDKG